MRGFFKDLVPVFALVFSAVPAFSQTYGCGEPAETDFNVSILSDQLNEALAVDIAPDGRAFLVEKVTGRVMLYKPSTGTTVQSARLTIYSSPLTAGGNRADGLLGLALDPNFATNNWVYLYYSVPGNTAINRISRFTLVGDLLNLASESVLLDVSTQRDHCCHSAGDLLFGADGNLYLSTGDNASVTTMTVNTEATGTSGNTNDLRGKILRIRPNPSGGYTIPSGNLFPPGTARTRPEIYAMGLRNPFRFAIDPQRGWVLSGDVGPDNGAEYDEFNLIKDAGNYGWPYFNGNNNPAYPVGGSPLNPAAPVNTATNNTGLQQLPPARTPVFWYTYTGSTQFPNQFNRSGGRVVAAGPVYYYNPLLSSTVKFPPHFQGKWFIFDFRQRWIKAVTMDAQGSFTSVRDWFTPTLFGSAGFTRVTDMKFGPNGALYVLEYGHMSDYTASNSGTLFRIEYRAPSPNCLPSTPVSIADLHPGRRPIAHRGPGSRFVLPAAVRGLVLYDMGGRMAWKFTLPEARSTPMTLQIPGGLPVGVYHWKPIR